jgi:GST-like protein
MIDLHYAPTPNGWKISIMLEELGLPYTIIPVNIRAGEQFRPEFLAISPNNRIPAIVDRAPVEGAVRREARKNMFGQAAKEMVGRN